MAETKFSLGDALQFGWNAMKDNLLYFVGVIIVAVLPSVILSILEGLVPSLSIVWQVASFLVNIMIGIWFIKIALGMCDGVKVSFGELLSCGSLFINYAAASIVFMILVTIGFILLIVPGIIVAIACMFFTYLIVDKNMGPIESLKKSAAITKGARFDLFVFIIVLGIINIIGALCLGIGLFVTAPTTMVAMAYVYRQLVKEDAPSQTVQSVEDAPAEQA
ncbi:MAG: hypothetical protein P9M13_08610 [Candidatus Ancaeobacter aquaticus]|nr:hypothetical protein [Candidatus Ancaeobacter aquaticus]